MTSIGDTQSAASNLQLDGLSAVALGNIRPTQDTSMSGPKFWSTGRRRLGDPHSEVMEVSFGSKRLVNHLSFQLAHFPQVSRVEYLDATGNWQRFTYAKTVSTTVSVLTGRKGHKKRKKVNRYLTRALHPVECVIGNSVPIKVDTAAVTSTQHFGKNHWEAYSLPVTPVTTSKVRFVLRRATTGEPPVNPQGRQVAYSLAIRNLQIGYRVLGTDDLPTPLPPPTPEADWWAASKDILGSRVVYSTYRQNAPAVIDGDTATYWRSEPQPFPFAVVNLFLDLRDVDGLAPVIDRFWIDPVTVGPLCNVYYSDSEPVGEFDGVSLPIPDQWKTEIGNPGTTVDAATNTLLTLNLGPTDQTGFVASNVYERIHYSQPWWIGLDARSLVAGDDADSRPIVSMGSTRIVQEDGALKVIAPTGEVASVTLDPTVHAVNASYRLVVAYYPADEATHRSPYLRLSYRLGDRDPEFSEIAVVALEDLDSPVKIGLHPDPVSTDVAGMAVKGLVVKSESLTPEAEDWFFDEGAEFVADPSTPMLDRGTAQNARLRMHPMFRSTTDNIFGVVGGPGDRFDEMEWTPVTRDFTLRRGYLHLLPKRAKYWKFEMTRLVPQIYENFVTIDREALVFPPDVVDAFNRVSGGQTSSKIPNGMNTVASLADQLSYSDALNVIQNNFSPDAASALIVKEPGLAQQAARSGWIWTYQPWHIGASAPQFIGTQVHRYEAIRVRHSTKVAFFAGLREVRPVRVDYTFDDDTPEYVEHMLDTAFIDLTQTTGIEQTEGSLTATSPTSEATSVGMQSYRTVRGVQFASQETDAIQVLDDSDFIASDLTRWTPYGDASLDRLGPSDVLVNRGWFPNTWGMLEDEYPTWGDLDGVLYGALEGNNPATGAAEGGIVSQTYTPTGAGKVTALAKISATEALSGPLTLEIIAANDNRVLASTQQTVAEGDLITAEVSYANARVETQSGGQVFTRTWGDLENSLGVADIPANGTVNITAPGGVVGATPWDDGDDATYATSTSTSGGTVLTLTETDLPSSPTSPAELTSVKVTVRTSADVPDDVRGRVSIHNPGTSAEIGFVDFDLSGAPVTQDVTVLPTDPTAGPAALGAAIQAGARVRVALDPLSTGGSFPVADRTMTIYELSVEAAADSTWGDLDSYRWADLEAYTTAVVTDFLKPDLRVRVRQQGTFRDVFHVHRIGLYESPIAWYFSNDDGRSWWEAIDVRNDPYGVLMFPEVTSADPMPDDGKVLRWKAKFFVEGSTVNALHIRPWYGSHARSVDGAHTMEALGPNVSIYDNMPATVDHPMWTPRFNPIERAFTEPVVTPLFWRNLSPTPSGESPEAAFDVSGGTVTTQADWTYIVEAP